jgi:hypothetical protein
MRKEEPAVLAPDVDRKALRQSIVAYLSKAKESLAKSIIAGVAMAEHPSLVIDELNAMRTDTLVECEKKKGRGNELWYWLTNVPADGAQESDEEEPLASRLERYEAAISEIHDVCREAGIGPGMVHERVKALAEKISERSQAEMSLLNVIADIRAAIGDPTGKIMLGELAKAVGEAVSTAEANGRIGELQAEAGYLKADLETERMRLAACGVAAMANTPASVAERITADSPYYSASYGDVCSTVDREMALRADVEKLRQQVADERANGEGFARILEEARAELAAERQAREALQEQINADPAVDVKDAARGYLVRAPKRRLRILTKPENAVAAAMSAARNGSGRGDVFALVPVGTARRGAEWTEAN